MFQNKEILNSLQKSSGLMFDSSTFLNSSCKESSSSSLVSFLTLTNLLHKRFGHPNKHVLQTIIRKLPLHYVSNQSPDFCNACKYGMMHQFHFPLTEIKSKSPLELIHIDL